MSLRFIDSFDHYASGDLTEKYHSTSGTTGPIIRAGAGRRGTKCLETDAGQWVMLTLDPQPRWILGFAMRYTATTVLGAGCFVDVSYAGGRQLYLSVTPEGFVQAIRGPGASPTLLGQSTQALHTQMYYYIEASFLVHASAGEVIVRVDGVPWLSLSGINTQAVVGALPNAVRLGSESTAGLVNLQHDDLYICDGTGAAPYNTFLGDCRVDALYPNADGTYTAWTPSAGTAHYAMVEEPTPNDDTDYVSETTAGGRDSYQLEPLPTMPNPEVLAVQALVSARKEDVDEIRISPLLVSGAVTAVSSVEHALTASYLYARDLWSADPAGGAWTEAAVNSLQVGVERLA